MSSLQNVNYTGLGYRAKSTTPGLDENSKRMRNFWQLDTSVSVLGGGVSPEGLSTHDPMEEI